MKLFHLEKGLQQRIKIVGCSFLLLEINIHGGILKDGSWIDARTLHKELGVGKKFTDWIKGRVEKYEFVENEDWKLTNHKIGKRSNVKVDDYSLTLDMAKEFA